MRDRSTVRSPDGTQARLNGSSTLTYLANFNAVEPLRRAFWRVFRSFSPDDKHRFR